MRHFLLALGVALAAPFLIASGAQAAPMLGLTVRSDSASSFQPVALGSNGGPCNFAPVSVGNNIGTQLVSSDYIGLATSNLLSQAGASLVITLTGAGFTSPFGASNWLTQFTGNVANGSAAVTAQSYLDNSDTLSNPGCTAGCTLLSNIDLGSIDLGNSATSSAATDGSFALTEVMTVMTTGSTTLSLDASVSNVPEPCRSPFSGRALPAMA